MKSITVFLFCFLFMYFHLYAQSNKPYKGNAILGNGNVCLVYSDDPRITARSGNSGIQHYYFQDYIVDYIRGTFCELSAKKGGSRYQLKSSTTGMQNFYRTGTQLKYDNGQEITVNCFVHQNDVTALKYTVKKAKPGDKLDITLLFRKVFTGDRRVERMKKKFRRN
ncbi:MAG: hypothetical protein HYV28_07215 [Ignavibacteriales bacterium]|nr:hypothetical protein [Ignavibacteriales bacterium]